MTGEKEMWCRFVECGESNGNGNGEGQERKLEDVTFKPIEGNAVFWMNYAADGRGYEEAWHAALPVTKGTKVGLNIWSWHQPGISIP